MIEDEFLRIAESEDADYYFQEKKFDLTFGAKTPCLIYLLKIYYKSHLITIKNVAGTSFSGSIDCEFYPKNKNLSFEITSKSNFSKLFFKNKNSFNVITENSTLDKFFTSSKSLCVLSDIADRTTFEPQIKGCYVEGIYKLTTEYSLQFSNWTQVLEPFIEFYKEFIDTFN